MNNYILGDILGSGAEGSTYRAVDILGRREVAIKIVYNNKLLGLDWKDIYTREVYALQTLSNETKCSKYVACLYDHFVTDNGFAIVMELVQGEVLNSLILKFVKDLGLKRPNLNLELRWIIIGRLLEAYTYINSNGIEHRDITEYNVIWTGENVVFIDFGFACNLLTDDCEKSRIGKIDDLKNLIILIDKISSLDYRKSYKSKTFDYKYKHYIKIWDDDRAIRLASITSKMHKKTITNIIQIYNGNIS